MKTSYIFVGDSIVYGIGDFAQNGWTSMFKNRIINLDENSLYCSNYVHIAAYPGFTSSDITPIINHILGAFAFPSTNNELILSVGVNDTQTINNKQKVDLEDFKSNIIKMINIARTVKNCNITILGLTRIGSNIPFEFKPGKFLSNTTIGQYDLELEKICQEHKVSYIKMSDALDFGDYADKLHPNNEGHNKLFNRVLSKMKERESDPR